MTNSQLEEKCPCPCCGYKTYCDKPDGTYDICPVCFWEDDPVQMNEPNFEGGANHVSLKQAQKNFLEFGASEERVKQYVRQPKIDEPKDLAWRLLD